LANALAENGSGYGGDYLPKGSRFSRETDMILQQIEKSYWFHGLIVPFDSK
jgi:hypothetical protein